VTSTVSSLTAERRSSRTVVGRTDSIRADLSLEPSACRGERVARDIFVDVNSLSVLSEVVKSREAT